MTHDNGTQPVPAPEGAKRPRLRVPELLAPAGTMDAFKAALAAGADAIYCGLGSFNARRNADNLSIDDLARACDLAHVAGSRVYVTTNILIGEDEMADALTLVHDAWLAGADAFIVQDWGLLRNVRALWPQVELHLSTQANVADPLGVDFARDQGCSRVTLARELSLREIARCSGRDVELEVFGHGALCVCYSGQCLLSSAQRGRSANRGLCRQPCRLPYELLDGDGRSVASVGGSRLLSPRDCRSVFDLPALMAAGVGSIKVEGRMKAPDYVATVTGAYREALDLLSERAGELLDLVPADSLPDDGGDASAAWRELDCRWAELLPDALDRRLRRSFNRDFTNGYLHGRSGNEIMSYERGNNRGQLCGTVEGIRGKAALVALTQPVSEGDLLELRSPERFDDYVTVACPREARQGELLRVTLPREVPMGSKVRVIRSEESMARARDFSTRAFPRLRPVSIEVSAVRGEPLSVTVEAHARDAHPAIARDASSTATGDVVQAARTRAVSERDLIEHVGRMGGTPFAPDGLWDVRLDPDVGMGFSGVHSVRARALDALRDELLSPWRARRESMADAPYSLPSSRPRPASAQGDGRSLVCAMTCTPEQARVALEAGADRVYALVEDLSAPGSSALSPTRAAQGEQTASATSWPDGTVPVLGEVGREADLSRAERLVREGAPVAAGTVAGLALAARSGALAEVWDTLELHNSWSLEALAERGAQFFWMSPELDLLQLGRLCEGSPRACGIVVAGHQRMMTTEHCVLQSMGPCARACATCERRRELHTLRDEFGRTTYVTSDAFGRSRLWEVTALDATPQIGEFLRMGMTRFMVDARLLGPRQTRAAVERTRAALEAAISGRTPAPRLAGHGSGHLFARIG
jgi:putative protease